LTSIPRSSQTAALSGIDHKQEFERHREMVLPSLAGSSCSESRTAAPKNGQQGKFIPEKYRPSQPLCSVLRTKPEIRRPARLSENPLAPR
jgi:hypothetical protein